MLTTHLFSVPSCLVSELGSAPGLTPAQTASLHGYCPIWSKVGTAGRQLSVQLGKVISQAELSKNRLGCSTGGQSSKYKSCQHRGSNRGEKLGRNTAKRSGHWPGGWVKWTCQSQRRINLFLLFSSNTSFARILWFAFHQGSLYLCVSSLLSWVPVRREKADTYPAWYPY